MAAREAFLAALPPPLRAEAGGRAVLAAVLARLVAAARAAHPGIALEEGRFLAHLAARLPTESAARRGPRRRARRRPLPRGGLRPGAAPALAAFERGCLAPLAGALGRLAVPGTDADDLAQLVRARLLAPDAQGRRRINDYAGVGSLRRWVRTTAVRLALNAGRGSRRSPPTTTSLAGRLHDERDGELAFLKDQYRPAFAAALRESLATLAAADQLLLRQRYVDASASRSSAALSGVHRATALRRLERARIALLADLRARLWARLRLEGRELESLLRLVASRLEVTLGPAG